MSFEKRSVTQDGVLKEKVEGLTLKIFKSVVEYHAYFIPHIVEIITNADIKKRNKKGYRSLFCFSILVERRFKKGLRSKVLFIISLILY
ncbi:MAG: hypothetical protein A2099_00435 [Planctomycetes bacterium GWF2_39_10]|nr:MAG: hypothetical protein A2099_00435 [Planctomycetes bacterium GWF2_39_10]OHB99143.1 MAG: hypothetical protein A3G70_03600 [Planctomycetes bacterium RIFCSPLOWO2_12_FULL_39_13]